jgi:hypothetical protein
MKWATPILFVAFHVPTAAAQEPGSGPARSGVEEIYIARTLVQSRLASLTPECAQERVGFAGATVEQQFTLHSVTTRSDDGLLTNTKQNTIGHAHGCLGPSGDPLKINFFLEGTIGAIPFKAIGDCRWAMPDQPEPGIRFLSCFLPLGDLPEGYVSGYLTSSSISSRQAVGEVSDPFGYLQSSIATIRLWRRR